MPGWTKVPIVNPATGKLDTRSLEVELNKRLRYFFENIDVTQLLLELNNIPGILKLSKGGTGSSLSAPAADRIMFYDLSGVAVDWLEIGSGLQIIDKVLSSNAGTTVQVTEKTASATLLVSEQGVIEANSATDITLTLPLVAVNTGVSYFITNVNAGTVTVDPFGSETIMGDSDFDLYQDENIQIVSNGTQWIIR